VSFECDSLSAETWKEEGEEEEKKIGEEVKKENVNVVEMEVSAL
jgi:hypothetical protein